nr:hypothetical protein [Tanacetum cinerariifolium]
TMDDVNINVPAGQAPTMAPAVRTAYQILPCIRWAPIGKSNCYLDLDKSCQLDEQWFDLTKDTLRDALQITPVNNQAFSSPPSSDALINFVNKLGYPKLVRNLSTVVTNDMFQPWRALTTIINLCLTGKTSGFERPRAPRKHKFYPRPDSSLHLPNEEPVLGYLKFNPKGTKREVFGMPIPGSLITADICYLKILEYLLSKHPKPNQITPHKPPPNTRINHKDEYTNRSTTIDGRKKMKKHGRNIRLRKRMRKEGETGSNPDSPALKPTKTAWKPKPTAPKPISTPRSVDESVAEDVPEKEPQVGDEAANIQRALEESVKSMYDVPR